MIIACICSRFRRVLQDFNRDHVEDDEADERIIVMVCDG